MLAIAIWDGIREGLGSVLAFFYSVIPNSGVAIILLTVAVRLVCSRSPPSRRSR